MKGFSVIIPTLNRTDFLINTLNDLKKQVFHLPYEIIIVDQSIEEDLKIKKLVNENNFEYHFVTNFRGLPEARNFGASKAKYEFLLFLDDDIKCDKNLLGEHYKFLSKSDIAVVAGGITEMFKSNLDCDVGKFIKRSATPLRGFHKKTQKEVDHGGGGNFSVKSTVFQQICGVDENLTKGAALYEETDFCLRVKKANLRIYYNYYAHVFHLAADTGGCRVPDISKYIFSMTRNRTLIIKRHLKWYFKITAHLYLFKMMLAYLSSYRDRNIVKEYFRGLKEGHEIDKKKVINSFTY